MKRFFVFTLILALFFRFFTLPVTAHIIPTVTHDVRLEYFEDRIEYTISYTYDSVIVHRFLQTFDTNNDHTISKEEENKWIEQYFSKVHVSINGEAQKLEREHVSFPTYSEFISGGVAIKETGRIVAQLGCNAPSLIEIRDDNALLSVQDDIYGFEHVNRGCLGVSNIANKQNIGSAVVGETKGSSPIGKSDQKVSLNKAASLQGLKDILNDPSRGNGVYIIALIIAVVVGALHALTPGHGKTLVAAYLVGQKGTVKDAFILAATTTVTHTLAIYILGLIALFATKFFYPEKIIPVLEGVSALSIFGMGIWLLVRRWDEFKKGRDLIGHEHSDAHTLVHSHDGGPTHSHSLEELKGDRLTLMSLISLGFSGGIVPCVDALAIMILSISLNQIAFGMVLIFFFSLGLAGVLVVLGVILVTSKKLLESRLPIDRFSRFAPVVSAIIIVVLGVYLTLRALKI